MGNKVIYASEEIERSDQTNSSIKGLFISISIIYLAAWFSVYLNLPVPFRLLVLAAIIFFSLRSIRDAAAIFLMVLFFPFFTEFLGFYISGVNAERIVSIVFLYVGFQYPQKRKLRINRVLLGLLFVSMLSIQFSAEIRKIVQVFPEHEGGSPSLFNSIAGFYDFVALFLYIYLIWTRLTKNEFLILIDILLLCGLLEAVSIIFLVVQNPQRAFGSEFDILYLWRNPYFGHKNDWGMVLMAIVLIAYIKQKVATKNKVLYVIVMGVVSMGVAFSLSRQAYVSLLLGFIIMAVLQHDVKPAIYLGIGLLVVIFIQPEFLMNRVQTLNVSNAEEFQNLSRKVGDLARNQFISNLRLVPRMFSTGWEYNWSEGFWNGITHQQGILGLAFHIIFYGYLIYRYYIIKLSNIKDLSLFASLMCAFFIIIFIANVNRRGVNLMHYDGIIQQFGILILFMIFYVEYWLIYYKQSLVTLQGKTHNQ